MSTENALTSVPVERVYECLCSKDSRNPLYADIYGWQADEPPPVPRVDCACDNCFYGRDKLAVEILRLRGETR